MEESCPWGHIFRTGIDEDVRTSRSDATTLYKRASRAVGSRASKSEMSRKLSIMDLSASSFVRETSQPSQASMVVVKPQRPHLAVLQASRSLADRSSSSAMTAVARKWVAADEQAQSQLQVNTLLKNGVTVTLTQLPRNSKALSLLGVARGYSYESNAHLPEDSRTPVRLTDSKGRSVTMTKAELARRLQMIGTIIPPGGEIPLSEWSVLCWRAKLAKRLRLRNLLRRKTMPEDDFGSLWDPKVKINATGILLNNVSLILEEHMAKQLLRESDTWTTTDEAMQVRLGRPAERQLLLKEPGGQQSRKHIIRFFSRSASSSIIEMLAPITPAISTNSLEMYTAADDQKYLRIEISEGNTTFLPSEARRINTPPLKRDGKASFFFDLDSPMGVRPEERPGMG